MSELKSIFPCSSCGHGRLVIYRNRRVPGTPWARRYLKCGVCGRLDSEIIMAGPPMRKSFTSVVPTSMDAKRKRGILKK